MSSALTLQRAQKLLNLGFEWSAKDPRMVPWETRYNQLNDFVVSYVVVGNNSSVVSLNFLI
jgi:hypothetical protein